jgi:RecA-family ATPase
MVAQARPIEDELDDAYRQQANGSAGAPLAALIGMPLEAFMVADLPKRPALLAPWLTTSSLAMIHARTGVGKTWLSLSIALAVATGGRLLKWSAPEPRKVVYLDGEMAGHMMQDRGRALLNGGSTGGRLIIVNPDLQPDPMPNLATPEGRARLEPLLDGAALLVIDNVSQLLRLEGDGTEGDKWAEQVQPWLLEKRRAGLAILLDHHSGKSGTQRGTSSREDILDVVIKLERVGDEQDGARFNVIFEKTRGFYGKDAETFEARLWTQANGEAVWSTSASGDSEEFTAFVEMLKDKVPVDKAAKDLKIHRATAYRWKAKAIDQGLVT